MKTIKTLYLLFCNFLLIAAFVCPMLAVLRRWFVDPFPMTVSELGTCGSLLVSSSVFSVYYGDPKDKDGQPKRLIRFRRP